MEKKRKEEKKMNLLIKNGNVVTPSEVYQGDIFIKNGKIEAIGHFQEKEDKETKIIEAQGKYVIPGAVDAHTHMDLQVGEHRAVDDFYTGTVAAACGGTTTIIDHIAFGPKGCNLHYEIDEYHKLAEEKAVIDYGFHGVVQHIDDKTLKELEQMVKYEGITSFKGYLTYDFKLEDDEILQFMLKMKELGGIPTFHAENDRIITYLREKYVSENKIEPIYHAKTRPPQCEAEAVSRLLYIASLAGDAPVYIVHLSTKEGLEAIKFAKDQGQRNIFTETCPQYLTLTEELYKGKNHEGLKYIMSPPLRTKEHCKALWKGLADGVIDVVATDHCPFHFAIEKQHGLKDFTKCPGGAPGVEERVRVLFSEGVVKNRISIEKFVETISSNPAKIFGIFPKKGALLPGSDGDIVIIDPNKEEVLTKKNMKSAVDYTAYEGMKVKGKIDYVILKGKIIVKDNEFLGQKGEGEFLKRNPHRPF